MKHVTKRCDRCGHVEDVPIFHRRCRRRKFGKGSYACWGKLQRVLELKSAAKAKEAPTMSEHEQYRQRHQKQLQKAQRARSRAYTRLTELAQAQGQIVKRIGVLDRAVRLHFDRSQMTDEQIDAVRARRPGRRKLRGIEL